MKYQDSRSQEFFSVNIVLFYICYAFIMLGAAYAIYLDFGYWDEPPIIKIVDVGGFVLMVISFILSMTGKITKNIGAALVLWIAAFMWVVSTIVTTTNGKAVENGVYTLLVLTAIAGGSAFLVHRQTVVILGLINFGILTFLTYYSPVPSLYNMYPLFAIVIIGFTVVLYYYRFLLDSLVIRLNNSYDNLQLTSMELKRLKDKAENLNAQNRPFVVFGKNTAGLVHDFKNDLSLFTASRSLLELKIQRNMPITPDDLGSLNNGIRRLEERIDRVKFITSAREDAPLEDLDLVSLAHHAVYPFTLTREVNLAVNFTFETPDEPVILQGQRFLLLQIMENVVRNSCEAIMEQGETGQITITVSNRQDSAVLSIHDTGPGIPFCVDCDREQRDCATCFAFEIGKTTKPNGSGYGMYNVMQALKNLKGTIQIFSGPERGTLIEMTFPRQASETTEPTEPTEP
ncbi:sensor histidine kinase [Spirochaeta lutea]|nr:HAMP domain-containing sensor histidine kinase [Spirochaeta lutea]